MAVTWNPADKDAAIVLTNADLTASRTSTGLVSVRATTGKSAGKWYFECQVEFTSSYDVFIGIASVTHSLGNFVGRYFNGWGWQTFGRRWTNNAYSGYGTTATTGDIIMLAVDVSAGKVWFGKNGVWPSSGDPGAGLYPAYTSATISSGIYAACSVYSGTSLVTAKFAEADLTYGLPSGFLAYETIFENTLPAESLIWTPQLLSQDGQEAVNTLPVESLIWGAQPLIVSPVLPAESLIWTPQTVSATVAQSLPAESLTWDEQAMGSVASNNLPVSAIGWTAKVLQQVYDAPSYAIARAVYRCYLTGDAEDPPVADLELPLASFQSRRRNGTQTYLAITVPNPVPYVAGINARSNGDIVIYSGFAVGDVENLTELLRVNFGSFRYDLGARSGTGSLSGHKQVTYTNPKTRALSGISYKSVTDGVTLVRCEPDMWLNPGDTADIGDSTFVVDTISYTIKPTLAYMEVQEASE